MILSDGVQRVLCFGDSNTFAVIPGTRNRYPLSERWTGVLQYELGAGWDVWESGLPGRTTDLDDTIMGRPDRAGFPAFRVLVESCAPLAAVVIMLGTNDLRTPYGRTPNDVARVLGLYLDHVRDAGALPATSIVLAAPPAMDEHASGFERFKPAPGIYDSRAARSSRRLPNRLRQLAKDRGVRFFDSNEGTKVGEDGAHLDRASHAHIGKSLAPIIRAAGTHD